VAEPPGKDQFAAAYAADNESNATNRGTKRPFDAWLARQGAHPGARQARI